MQKNARNAQECSWLDRFPPSFPRTNVAKASANSLPLILWMLREACTWGVWNTQLALVLAVRWVCLLVDRFSHELWFQICSFCNVKPVGTFQLRWHYFHGLFLAKAIIPIFDYLQFDVDLHIQFCCTSALHNRFPSPPIL